MNRRKWNKKLSEFNHELDQLNWFNELMEFDLIDSILIIDLIHSFRKWIYHKSMNERNEKKLNDLDQFKLWIELH